MIASLGWDWSLFLECFLAALLACILARHIP